MKLSTRLIIAGLAGALTATAFHSNAAEKETYYYAELDGTYTCVGRVMDDHGNVVRNLPDPFVIKVMLSLLTIKSPAQGTETTLLIKELGKPGRYGNDGESGEAVISKPSNLVAFRYVDETSWQAVVFNDCKAKSKLGL